MEMLKLHSIPMRLKCSYDTRTCKKQNMFLSHENDERFHCEK